MNQTLRQQLHASVQQERALSLYEVTALAANEIRAASDVLIRMPCADGDDAIEKARQAAQGVIDAIRDYKKLSSAKRHQIEFYAGAKRREERLASGAIWAVDDRPTCFLGIWRVDTSDGWQSQFTCEQSAIDFIAQHKPPEVWP